MPYYSYVRSNAAATGGNPPSGLGMTNTFNSAQRLKSYKSVGTAATGAGSGMGASFTGNVTGKAYTTAGGSPGSVSPPTVGRAVSYANHNRSPPVAAGGGVSATGGGGGGMIQLPVSTYAKQSQPANYSHSPPPRFQSTIANHPENNSPPRRPAGAFAHISGTQTTGGSPYAAPQPVLVSTHLPDRSPPGAGAGAGAGATNKPNSPRAQANHSPSRDSPRRVEPASHTAKPAASSSRPAATGNQRSPAGPAQPQQAGVTKQPAAATTAKAAAPAPAPSTSSTAAAATDEADEFAPKNAVKNPNASPLQSGAKSGGSQHSSPGEGQPLSSRLSHDPDMHNGLNPHTVCTAVSPLHPVMFCTSPDLRVVLCCVVLCCVVLCCVVFLCCYVGCVWCVCLMIAV